MVQNDLNVRILTEEWLLRHAPDLYTPMLFTADFVAKKYGVSRERRTNMRCRASSAPPPRKPRAGSTPRSCRCPRWKYEQDKESGTSLRSGTSSSSQTKAIAPTPRLKA